MILWMVLTVMTAVAAAGLTIPLVRRYDARRARGTSVGVLKGQLAEVDAHAATGGVPEAEAEGLRTEIKRRLLAEAREAEIPARPLGEKAMLRLALGLVAVVAVAATGLYAVMGRPDLASRAAASVARIDAAHPGGGDIAGMIGQLEARLKATPADPEGWRMLGWSYFQTGRFAEAAEAYGRASALAPANSEYLSAQGESLVQASGGQVTPAAKTAFEKALAATPDDPRARYFLAVAKDQQGDRKGAMADWIALIRSAPEGAPWAAEVRGFVEKLARDGGEDISGQLPPAPVTAAAPAAPRGPTPDQVAAAGQLSAGDQQAMIRGMVDRLDARLKSSPRDPDGWLQLMRARLVLGDGAAATAAYRAAMATFADTPATQASLRDAAKGLGVPGV